MKKKPEDLVAEIRVYCVAQQDPRKAGKWARYFREGYDAWGLLDKDHPIWNEKQQEWLSRRSRTSRRCWISCVH